MALNLYAQFNAGNMHDNALGAWAAGYDSDDSNMSQADTIVLDHTYRDETTLLHWERREFDERYTAGAVSTLRAALRVLLRRWREYRARRMDRHANATAGGVRRSSPRAESCSPSTRA